MANIPQESLDKYKFELENASIALPSHFLGDFANKYLLRLDKCGEAEKLQNFCGFMETLFRIGEIHGRKKVFDKFKKLIIYDPL